MLLSLYIHILYSLTNKARSCTQVLYGLSTTLNHLIYQYNCLITVKPTHSTQSLTKEYNNKEYNNINTVCKCTFTCTCNLGNNALMVASLIMLNEVV